MARKTNAAKEPSYWNLIVAIGVPIITFLGGMVWNGYNIAEKIATKPYVDDRFKESMKHTDEKTAQVLKDAFDHSDTNRREILREVDQITGSIKESNAVLGTKVDMLLKGMQEVRDYTADRRIKR